MCFNCGTATRTEFPFSIQKNSTLMTMGLLNEKRKLRGTFNEVRHFGNEISKALLSWKYLTSSRHERRFSVSHENKKKCEIDLRQSNMCCVLLDTLHSTSITNSPNSHSILAISRRFSFHRFLISMPICSSFYIMKTPHSLQFQSIWRGWRGITILFTFSSNSNHPRNSAATEEN